MTKDILIHAAKSILPYCIGFILCLIFMRNCTDMPVKVVNVSTPVIVKRIIKNDSLVNVMTESINQKSKEISQLKARLTHFKTVNTYTTIVASLDTSHLDNTDKQYCDSLIKELFVACEREVNYKEEVINQQDTIVRMQSNKIDLMTEGLANRDELIKSNALEYEASKKEFKKQIRKEKVKKVLAYIISAVSTAAIGYFAITK